MNSKTLASSVVNTLLLTFFGVALHAVTALGQPVLTSMSPVYGSAGTEVLLGGSGLTTTEPVAVSMGGTPATILGRTAEQVRFVVPQAAATGPVQVTMGGQTYTYPVAFTVTRPMRVQIAPEAGIAVTKYTVGSLYGDAPGAGPSYDLQVAKGESTLVAASAGDLDPVLMAIVTDEVNGIVLSAETTALALLYFVPGVATADPAEGKRRLSFFRARPELAALTAAIQSRLRAGQDYVDVPAVEGALIGAVEAYLTEYQPMPGQGGTEAQALAQAQGGFGGGLEALTVGSPRDLVAPGYEGLRKLASSAGGTGVNEMGVPFIKVKVKSAPTSLHPSLSFEVNPLDWMANLYELDPGDPDLDSLEKVRRLRGDFSNVYQRMQARPLDRLHVKAKLATRILDLPELAADQLSGFLTPAALKPKDYLEVPADRPGLYLIRAFSGARFDPQKALISMLPQGQREANHMTVLNILLASQDGLSFLSKEVGGFDCRQKFLISLATSTLQTVEREAAQGVLSSEVIKGLVLNAAKSFVKDYFIKCVLLDSKLKGMSQSGKAINASIGILGKIATGGKILERMNALANLAGSSGNPQRVWTAQAIEDTLVVVGNPWQPRISGFFPQEGYRGALVRIDGRNFNAQTNLNIVTFGQLSTDPENPPVQARAEVVAASESSIVVRVPEEAETGFITVTVPENGTASTVGLESPFQQFVVLADPVITSIEPNPPVAGQVMLIRGNHFARMTDQQELVFGIGPSVTAVGRRELIGVRTPNSTAPNSVRVRVGGRMSNIMPFTPTLPAQIPAGATITISTAADGNAADQFISLREAILLAGGGVSALGGRSLTSPPDPRPPQRFYETDFVRGNPGAASRDTITVALSLEGETLLVSSQLPDLESFDSYDLKATIAGQTGAGDAFRIPGKRDILFRATAIRNFGGNGFVLSGPASNNYIYETLVEQCGGDAYRLDGGAWGNHFYRVQGRDCLNGVHFSGPGVAFNRIVGFEVRWAAKVEFAGNRNFGAVFDNGAVMNELTVFSISSNSSGGIRITGAETTHNVVQGFGHYEGFVVDNGGPGIWINSPSNIVRQLNIAGNQGDGILLEDNTCHEIRVDEVRIGYSFYEGRARPNRGSGLHIRNGAHRIVLGTADGDVSNAEAGIGSRLNYVGGNRDHGIWIEGASTREIRVNGTVVGAVKTGDDSSIAMPNGTNGIAITGRASGVQIGGPMHSSVVIANHTNGAGIYLAQTSGNFVLGCKIGKDDIRENRFGNRIGVHITEGSFDNVIGVRGIRQVFGSGGEARIFNSANSFFANTTAGIVLESGIDPRRTILPGEIPSGGNIVQNNIFGARVPAGLENRVGIEIRSGAMINRIGGVNPGEPNLFNGNTDAGILIDGGVIARPQLANRIIGNRITSQGARVANPGDPLAGLPAGVGIAIINGAAGHIVGGSNPGEENRITENHVGVQIVQSSFNQVIGNMVDRNTAAGIVLLRSTSNTVGPFNDILRNGLTAPPSGGLALQSSGMNFVIGNHVGLRATDTIGFGTGNKHFGIGLFDSAQNVVGDLGGKNVIVGHTNGIVISGPLSSGNQVANNHIGFSPVPGVFTGGNTQTGIRLENGAHDNEVGGERPVKIGAGMVLTIAPNHIHRNTVDGVRVEGGGTLGNSILYNSIADHTAGLGIENVNAGNAEITPPTLVSYNGVDVAGTVAPAVPNGSRVQFFSDTADEGRSFLGDALVVGGQFRFALPIFAGPRINATVTHALAGHTSEFAPLIVHTNNRAGLLVQRVRRPPASIPTAVPGPPAVAVAIRLLASGSPVVASSFTFRTTGSAIESAPGTAAYLYNDEDKNGELNSADLLLSGPRTFSTNNASIAFPSLGRILDPGLEQHWLLVITPATNTPVSETFSFEIPSEAFVTSRSLLTGEQVTEAGEFPLQSDTLQVTAGQAVPTDLRISLQQDGSITLQWTGTGQLERGPSVTGPWTAVPDSRAPFSVKITEEQQFYRFRP